MRKIYLSVVIPCYNEAANLRAGALDQVARYLKKQSYGWEVVISDDGSTDESLKLVQKFVRSHQGFRILKNKHGGKAAAVKSGVKSAKGEIVLMTDMDQSTPIGEVEKLLPFFEHGFGVVIGSRGLARKGTAWYRKLISVGFWLGRSLFVLPEIKDTQCGFKAFEAKLIKKIFPKLQTFKKRTKSKGWTVSAFDVELLFMAKKAGAKIKEVEVDWENRDVSTTKQHNFIKDSKNMAIQVINVWMNNLKGIYEEK